ncbi:hypothetical protein K2173_024158 [Erythroxylum novogranatense]|uniref:Late embryogenesis abundant protein LEA-2 subgroup domain-containing protein n=1 Tax=Erythroxylum novogranatense TaxID=1862640 RepID=A0AAV8UET1_9ROSI|nr:hypothetical protein K2173_024158 [Erythroxylum novogranatense]
MAEKQPHLNGGYYGPAIPPQRSYHRHRSSGCGCGCCLLSFLLKLIVTAAIIIGVAIFVFWLIVRPNRVKFHVTDSNLSQFNFTANNTLQYNLALNVTIRNPNKKIGIYYDSIEARAFYEDHRLNSVFLTPFYQGHKNTTVLNPVFRGQQLVLLTSDESSQFNEDKTSGVYDIYVKLYLRIRFKVGKFKTGKLKPKIGCDLKVPLNSGDGRLAGVYETTNFDY